MRHDIERGATTQTMTSAQSSALGKIPAKEPIGDADETNSSSDQTPTDTDSSEDEVPDLVAYHSSDSGSNSGESDDDSDSEVNPNVQKGEQFLRMWQVNDLWKTDNSSVLAQLSSQVFAQLPPEFLNASDDLATDNITKETVKELGEHLNGTKLSSKFEGIGGSGLSSNTSRLIRTVYKRVGGFPCKRHDCPCTASHDGTPHTHCCGMTCKNGTPCSMNVHTKFEKQKNTFGSRILMSTP